MASIRLSTTLRNSARQFRPCRSYAFVPRGVPFLFKANASTATETGNSESSTATNINGPSPNGNSAEVAKALNGNGEVNGITFGNGIGEVQNDWSKSYHGLSAVAFSKDIADILQAPVDPLDIEMKPGQSFLFQC